MAEGVGGPGQPATARRGARRPAAGGATMVQPPAAWVASTALRAGGAERGGAVLARPGAEEERAARPFQLSAAPVIAGAAGQGRRLALARGGDRHLPGGLGPGSAGEAGAAPGHAGEHRGGQLDGPRGAQGLARGAEVGHEGAAGRDEVGRVGGVAP